LAALGAVDAAGAITDTGRELLTIAAAPRIARLLAEARRRGVGEEGALLAALAAERDILLEARAFGGGDEAPWPEGPSELLMRAPRFASRRPARLRPRAPPIRWRAALPCSRGHAGAEGGYRRDGAVDGDPRRL